jgi:hypothetical protein
MVCSREMLLARQPTMYPRESHVLRAPPTCVEDALFPVARQTRQTSCMAPCRSPPTHADHPPAVVPKLADMVNRLSRPALIRDAQPVAAFSPVIILLISAISCEGDVSCPCGSPGKRRIDDRCRIRRLMQGILDWLCDTPHHQRKSARSQRKGICVPTCEPRTRGLLTCAMASHRTVALIIKSMFQSRGQCDVMADRCACAC